MQSVEGRTDWLTIQTIVTAEFLKVPLKDLPKLAKQIRKIFIEQTEKLASQALEEDQFLVGDIADSVKLFYTALPQNFFGVPNQRPRPKSASKALKSQTGKKKKTAISKESSDESEQEEEDEIEDLPSPIKKKK